MLNSTTKQAEISQKVIYAHPTVEDMQAVYELLCKSKPIEVNSFYCYLLLAQHFSKTCLVLRSENDPSDIIGFIAGYIPPTHSDTLFIWQIAIDSEYRGQGLAQSGILELLSQLKPEIKYLEGSINPSNKASQALFHSISQTLKAPLSSEEILFQQDIFNEAHEDEILFRVGPLQ